MKLVEILREPKGGNTVSIMSRASPTEAFSSLKDCFLMSTILNIPDELAEFLCKVGIAKEVTEERD